MNTLKELADAIEAHQDVYDTYVEEVAQDIADAQAEAEAEAARLDGVLKGELQGEIDADVEVEKLRAEGVEAGFETRIKALEDAKDTHVALTADEIASAINTGEGSRRCDASNYISDIIEENYNIKGVVMNDLRIRKLTPKECWRLMGFSDSDYEKANKCNSNTQLYKQAGNSIVVNVLEEILKKLLKESNND
jgi:site-specific DNA-cytosine methylase